ncbi:MAG: pseudouridine synthase, partial [Thermomicrobiales bacterium]
MERLQRILSSRGVASRRVAEELIVAGRVSVNGNTVTELGTKADPANDEIRVDGKVVRPQRRRYVMLNKPRGYITTTSDDRDRQTVMELVQTPERLYPVGRLDRDTEGLLLLTNDGELANRVMHPKFGLEKEYHVLT